MLLDHETESPLSCPMRGELVIYSPLPPQSWDYRQLHHTQDGPDLIKTSLGLTKGKTIRGYTLPGLEENEPLLCELPLGPWDRELQRPPGLESSPWPVTNRTMRALVLQL